MTKLLIDECLSGKLALMARDRGHFESSHVVWIGKAGWKDWQLKPLLLSEMWVLVTNNSKDFRGPKEDPGSSGQFAGLSWQPGLICLNLPPEMSRERQLELFARALNELEIDGDLTNQVLEINSVGDEYPIEILRYDLPKKTI